MMTAESLADARMMGIVHAAFRRDLARVRLVLTAAAPQGGRRQAVAAQVVWLMHRLHEHHQTEDARLVAAGPPAQPGRGAAAGGDGG